VKGASNGTQIGKPSRRGHALHILGVELAANKLNYVLLVCEGASYNVAQANRLELSDTRSRGALKAFQQAMSVLISGTKPDLIGIKSKPESGALRAGAAALKMEGILLAASPCDVDFVSGQRVNACDDGEGIKAYHQPAFKAAVAAFRKQAG
jgi:hypothetical protein